MLEVEFFDKDHHQAAATEPPSSAPIDVEVKEKGMQFIEVDKVAFSQKCSDAIYQSLSAEMKKVYLQVSKMKNIRDVKSNKQIIEPGNIN